MAKALTPWRPHWGTEFFPRDMRAFVERFFGEREWPWLAWEEEVYPRVETHLEGNTFVVTADLPGVEPKEVEVTVEGPHLTIKGERKATEEHANGKYRHREVRYGAFARTLTLPAAVEAEKVEARYHNGVLEVRVPLPAEAAPKKVAIEVKEAEPKKVAA
jgi:HSP20 family protein